MILSILVVSRRVGWGRGMGVTGGSLETGMVVVVGGVGGRFGCDWGCK